MASRDEISKRLRAEWSRPATQSAKVSRALNNLFSENVRKSPQELQAEFDAAMRLNEGTPPIIGVEPFDPMNRLTGVNLITGHRLELDPRLPFLYDLWNRPAAEAGSNTEAYHAYFGILKKEYNVNKNQFDWQGWREQYATVYGLDPHRRDTEHEARREKGRKRHNTRGKRNAKRRGKK